MLGWATLRTVFIRQGRWTEPRYYTMLSQTGQCPEFLVFTFHPGSAIEMWDRKVWTGQTSTIALSCLDGMLLDLMTLSCCQY